MNNNQFGSQISKPNRSDSISPNLGRMYYPKDEKFYREYQFNIIKSCLLKNSLVILPTGLGKTFIASCVMFNFYRWFTGKIFFLAPTKPLVNQQKESFVILFPFLKHNVIEITGVVSKEKRKELYKNNRIFFSTPQTLNNDIMTRLIDRFVISLLIFDEAHKAQRNSR